MTRPAVDNQPAVDVAGLVKRFGDFEAVRGIDLGVERGETVAFLGPNGAGKTTTVRVLTTLLRPDAGRASVAGYDVTTQAGQVRRVQAQRREGH